jgi:hypothetical protein
MAYRIMLGAPGTFMENPRGLSPSWGRRFCQCDALDLVKLLHRLQRHETNPGAGEAIFASHEKGRKPMPAT